jgi:hypothetical protein
MSRGRTNHKEHIEHNEKAFRRRSYPGSAGVSPASLMKWGNGVMESWSPQSYISSTLHYSAASAGETPALPGKQECACGRDRWRTPFIQENPALFRVSSRDPSRKGWSCASYLEIVFLAPSDRNANKTTSRQSVQSVPLHTHLPWLLRRSIAR